MDEPYRVLAVDGTNLLYRSHHALGRSGLSHAGRPIWAVHGTLLQIAKAVHNERPTHVLVALDMPGGCPSRRAAQPLYKANRTSPVPELASQLGWAPSALTQLGLQVCGIDNWEADDVLASAVTAAANRGWAATVVTSDRDAYQLLSEQVRVLTPDEKLVTVESLQTEKGLTPAQYANLAALRGEPSDNLPGVESVGAVTAAKLLARFGDLDRIFAATDRELREVVGVKTLANLRRDEGTARTTAAVAQLRRDLPVVEPTAIAEIDLHRCRHVGVEIGLPQASAKLAWALEQAQRTPTVR